LSALSVGLFALGGINACLGNAYFVGLSGVAAHYAWQMSTLKIDNAEKCWDLFQSNRYLGLILAVAIVFGKLQVNSESK
jgi:4-hydroxybenzoate polyprenyltransferase